MPRSGRSGRTQPLLSLVVALVLCMGIVVQGTTTKDTTPAEDTTTEEVTTTRLPTTTVEPKICKTTAELRDKNHKPIEGQGIELECIYTTPCDTNEETKWYKDKDNDNKTIDTGRILKLTNLDPKKNGDYSCQLGSEFIADSYKLTVGTRPIVTMTGPPGPVESGDTFVEIKCIVTEDSPKAKISWQLNETKSNFTGEIYNITKVDHEDRGFYRCNATNDIGTGYGIYHLDVLYAPVGRPSITPAVLALIAGINENFKCDTDSLVNRGNPEANRYKWTKYSNPISEETQMITLLSESVLDEFNLTCTLDNYYGPSDEAVWLHMTVEAPVIFEDQPKPNVNDTDFRYYPDHGGKFNLTYVISGSNFKELKLFRNSSDEELLKENYFTFENKTKNDTTFHYDQKEATEIILKWNLKKELGTVDVCSNLSYFDGVYTLQALGTAASKLSEANTIFIIETQFEPHWNSSQPQVINATLGKSVTIECNVCANPQPKSYTWQFGLRDVPDGVQDNGRELNIEELRADHFGEYGCTVGKTTFVITVEQIKPTPVAIIAGSTVAGIVVLVIIIVIAVVCVKKRKNTTEGSQPDVETQSLEDLSNIRSSRPKPKTKPKPALPRADECRPHHDYPHDIAPPVPSGPRPTQLEDDEDDHIYEQDVEDQQEIYDDIGEPEDDYITPTEGNEYVERARPHNSYHQRGKYQI